MQLGIESLKKWKIAIKLNFIYCICVLLSFGLSKFSCTQNYLLQNYDSPHLEGKQTTDEFEIGDVKPLNFEFYVNFGYLFITDELRDNLRTYFEVPLGVSFGYEQILLNLQYNLVFGNVRKPFEYKQVMFEEKTSYSLMNLSAVLGYRFLLSPSISLAPKVGIISSNLKGMNEEFEENLINYPTLKSNAPVFILNIDYDTMFENDRKENFEDFLNKKRRKYALFSRLQFLYTTPNYHRLSEDIGKGNMFMVSLGFGLHRHFLE
jgi:hypothetical protein